MKKITVTLLAVLGTLPLCAQLGNISSVDVILEENAFKNATNRYDSLISFFFPEESSLQEFSSSAQKLNIRTPMQERQILQALSSVQGEADRVKTDLLSDDRKIDFDLFSRALSSRQWWLKTSPSKNDPLYYTQALDSIFDLFLDGQNAPRTRNAVALARLKELPQLVAQAKQNLTHVPALLAQPAMEKAYYAYLCLGEISEGILATALDEFMLQDLKNQTENAQNAVKDLFEFFKALSQRQDPADFRMGNQPYHELLKYRYQIETKPSDLKRQLEKHLDVTQHALAGALAPFEATLEGKDITVVDGDSTREVPAKPTRKKKKGYIPPSAGHFYELAKDFPVPENTDLLTLLAQETAGLASQLWQAGVLKPVSLPQLKALPAYYAYQQPFLFNPKKGTDIFWVRVPGGNALAQQEMLQTDFNTPMRKVFISRFLVPGMYYRYRQTAPLSPQRKEYGSPTVENGWNALALTLAEENGFFTTPEEKLAAAWTRYLTAVRAVTDYRLQTQVYTYSDAWNFLINDQGFPQEQAEELLRQLAAKPGEDVSTVVGEEVLTGLYKKYAHQTNKHFTRADAIDLLLQTGALPPADLEKEVKQLYKEKK